MKLTTLINDLTMILLQQGDLEVYQASDEEGNNIFEVEEVGLVVDEENVVIIHPNGVDLND